jgi:hypothetical protein
MVEEVTVNKDERYERNANRQGRENSSYDRFAEEFMNDRMSSRSNTYMNNESNSLKGLSAPGVRSGIVTTYDADGNPTSDCHGPIHRGGKDRQSSTIDLPSPFPAHSGSAKIYSPDRADRSSTANNERRGIITTYDENGNATSDCHGPLPRGGGKTEIPNPFPPNGGDSPRPIPHPGPVSRPEPRDGGDNRINRPPLNEKELDDLSKDIADKLGDGRWKFGTPAEKEELQNQLKAAEERGELKLLVAKINEELARKGSDLHLDLKTTLEQDKFWPELSAFTSWKHHEVNLAADDGTVLDKLSFNGKEKYHPARY